MGRILGVVMVLIAGCGDDDGDGACRAAGEALCDRACECRAGEACAFTDETGSATISFDSRSDCVGLFVTLGCGGGGDPTIDYGACEAATSAGMCVQAGTDEMGNPQQAFVSPAACESMM